MVEKMGTRFPWHAVISVLLFAPASLLTVQGNRNSPLTSCDETRTVEAQPPPTNNAGPLGSGPWWVNADRSLWMQSATGKWHVGYNQKNMMIKPSGVRPTIAGVRIDGPSSPMEVRWVPQLAAEFQTMGLTFANAGCWKISATAGDRRLEVIVRIG